MARDWNTTLHLAYLDGELNSVSIHEGTVTEVAHGVIKSNHRQFVSSSRTYLLGERDWPVSLVFEAEMDPETTKNRWRHEFRSPDDAWPTTGDPS